MSLDNVMHPPSQQQDVFPQLKGCGFFHIIGEWVQKCRLPSSPQTHRAKRGGMF
jgi:hypothetical protein